MLEAGGTQRKLEHPGVARINTQGPSLEENGEERAVVCRPDQDSKGHGVETAHETERKAQNETSLKNHRGTQYHRHQCPSGAKTLPASISSLQDAVREKSQEQRELLVEAIQVNSVCVTHFSLCCCTLELIARRATLFLKT